MKLEIIADGLQFPEGPVVMKDGKVIVVEIARGTLSCVDGKFIEVIAELGGGPNGAALGPDGAIYICNNGGRFEFIANNGLLFPGPRPKSHKGGMIQRVDTGTGTFDTLYEECNGRRLVAPNDLVFDAQGGFWFTDHGSGQQDGGLFYAKPDGTHIVCWRDNQASPNGVGLSPDQKTLYFADTSPHRLWSLNLKKPGVIADPQPLSDGPLVQLPEGNLLDSLAVEADGKICIGTLINGGITICDPYGGYEHLAIPDPMTTNICFGGSDMSDAYLTLSASGKLAKVRWPRPGLKLNFQVGNG